MLTSIFIEGAINVVSPVGFKPSELFRLEYSSGDTTFIAPSMNMEVSINHNLSS
jgi:hypothetical protein